jgi:hypothetical protein
MSTTDPYLPVATGRFAESKEARLLAQRIKGRVDSEYGESRTMQAHGGLKGFKSPWDVATLCVDPREIVGTGVAKRGSGLVPTRNVTSVLGLHTTAVPS